MLPGLGRCSRRCTRAASATSVAGDSVAATLAATPAVAAVRARKSRLRRNPSALRMSLMPDQRSGLVVTAVVNNASTSGSPPDWVVLRYDGALAGYSLVEG